MQYNKLGHKQGRIGKLFIYLFIYSLIHLLQNALQLDFRIILLLDRCIPVFRTVRFKKKNGMTVGNDTFK